MILRLNDDLFDALSVAREVAVCQRHADAMASQAWAFVDDEGVIRIGDDLAELGWMQPDSFSVRNGDHVSGITECHRRLTLGGTVSGSDERVEVDVIVTPMLAQDLARLLDTVGLE